jgi:kynurenine formamidase
MPRERPRLVDLTRRITHEMLNFPGEPRPGFIAFGGLADTGFRCRQVRMPTHFGTHADAYSHFLPAGLRGEVGESGKGAGANALCRFPP